MKEEISLLEEDESSSEEEEKEEPKKEKPKKEKKARKKKTPPSPKSSSSSSTSGGEEDEDTDSESPKRVPKYQRPVKRIHEPKVVAATAIKQKVLGRVEQSAFNEWAQSLVRG